MEASREQVQAQWPAEPTGYTAFAAPTPDPLGWHLHVIGPTGECVASVDLPDWAEWRGASAGHRLIEHGYMVTAASHWEADRAAGWVQLAGGTYAAPVAPQREILEQLATDRANREQGEA